MPSSSSTAQLGKKSSASIGRHTAQSTRFWRSAHPIVEIEENGASNASSIVAFGAFRDGPPLQLTLLELDYPLGNYVIRF